MVDSRQGIANSILLLAILTWTLRASHHELKTSPLKLHLHAAIENVPTCILRDASSFILLWIYKIHGYL